ncbi:MAG: TetR family transcriptional regulator C-terminal domain-containing protein, partial [Mycobacteriales bacterium]
RAILDLAGAGQGSMYHHFGGKEDLAAAALRASAEDVLAAGDAALAGPGTSVERLRRYLLREREVLRGCPVGRMTGDADVLDSEVLHGIVGHAFDRLRALTVRTVEQGVADGELDATTVASELADTVLAVVQGGYVLARAAADPGPFDRAVRGAVALLESTRRKATS